MSTDIERLKVDPCARAELLVKRAAEIANGDPLAVELEIANSQLFEEGVVPFDDDYEAVALAYDFHVTRLGYQLPWQKLSSL
jgi:hypothetical protein